MSSMAFAVVGTTYPGGDYLGRQACKGMPVPSQMSIRIHINHLISNCDIICCLEDDGETFATHCSERCTIKYLFHNIGQ